MKRKGFTTVEILLMSCIGIVLAAMAVGAASRARAFSRSTVCLNNLRQISMAVENYQSDWKDCPFQLSDLYPGYLKETAVFKCPEDRLISTGTLPLINSYESFYINRDLSEEDPDELFLYCPRHFSGTKGIGVTIAYAASIMNNQSVTWNNIEIPPGTEVTGGQFKFPGGIFALADNNLKVGVFGSAILPDGKTFSIIYIPEGTTGNLTVVNNSESRFEIITPSIVADADKTQFTLSNSWDSKLDQATTQVAVNQGTMRVEDRAGRTHFKMDQRANNMLTVAVQCDQGSDSGRTHVPAKPRHRVSVHEGP